MRNIAKFLLLLTILIGISCNNTTNMFFGSGNAVDMENPIVEITSHSHNDVVRGVITFSGDASDDMWVDKVILYYVGYAKNRDGSVTLQDIEIGRKKLNSKSTHWSIDYDTTELPDSSVVFKVKVIDDDLKFYYVNITLQLDNHGPDILISSPTTNSENNPISNIFSCAIIPIELDSNVISRIEWWLDFKENSDIKISGACDYSDSPKPSNELLTFMVDPFDLLSHGYLPGFYKLHVIGYSVPSGTIGEIGQVSKEDASCDIYIDYSSSIPQMLITTPSSTDYANPSISSTQVVVSGAAVDDDGLHKFEFRWGVGNSDDILDEGEIVSEQNVLSKSFVYYIDGLTDGVYWVQGRVTDIKPNVSDWTEKYYFRVDSNYPRISWICPEQGSWYKGDDIQVEADIDIGDSADITKVQFKLGSHEWTQASDVNILSQDDESKISLPTSKLRFAQKISSTDKIYDVGGEFVYSLRAFKSESEYTESSIVFNVDKQPPDVEITSPDDTMHQLNQVICINGTAIDFVNPNKTSAGIVNNIALSIAWGENVVDVSMDDIVGIAGWYYYFDTWDAGIGMKQGGEEVHISFTATDVAGNKSMTFTDVIVDQSTDIPIVSVSNFRDGDKKYGIFTVSGRASDDDGVKGVQVFMTDNLIDATTDVLRSSVNLLNGQAGVWQKCSGTENWSYLLDLSSFDRGQYRFFYRSVDINGKYSTYGGLYQGLTFFVDPDLPQIDFDLPTYLNAAKTFQGTVVKNASDNQTYIKSVEYKISGSGNQVSWTAFVEGDNLEFSDDRQTAEFSITYDDALINQFGQGDVSISIRATDNTDRQSTAEDTMFVDTVAVKATLQPPKSLIVRDNQLTLYGTIFDSEPSSGIYPAATSIVYSYDGVKFESIVDGAGLSSLSNINYKWNIPTTVKDGLISIKLISSDKALNEDTSVVENVRLARYTPTFSALTINGLAVSDYMSIAKNATFSGEVSDSNSYDTASRGVTRVSVYALTDATFALYDKDSLDVSKYVTLFDEHYDNENTNFNFNYEFNSTYNYILYRAFDRAGGWTDKIYRVITDIVGPTQKFTYSSVGAVDSSGKHSYIDKSTYSDTLWVKLDALDKTAVDGQESYLIGTTISVGVGTASGENDIMPVKPYTSGNIMKLDLKDYHSDIYINYTINDIAGNTTSSSVKLTSSDSRPVINCSLGQMWLNASTIGNISATAGSAKVKFSSLDYDISNGNINNLTLNSTMFDVTQTSTVDFNRASGGTSLIDQETFSIVLVATDSSNNDTYEKRTFVYDASSPVLNVNIKEDFGASFGHVSGNRLSGIVTFYGEFTDDSLGARENVSDFTMTLNVDNKVYPITAINKTDRVDGSGFTIFEWSFEYDTTEHGCGTNIHYKFNLTDRATNKTTVDQVYSVVPFIRSLNEVKGSLGEIRMFGSAYQNAAENWCNVNYNENYSYRVGSGDISLVGFNLDGVSFVYDSGNVTTSQTATTATLPSATFSKSGKLTAQKNGTTSEEKNITVFSNYGTGTTAYNSIANCDAVLRDGDLFSIIYQKHTENIKGKGSLLLRDYETAERTFEIKKIGEGTTDLLASGFNRFWFINVVKDKQSGLTKQSTLPDNKYYLMFGDSEFNGDRHAQKGVQLMGRFDGWQTLASVSRVWQSNFDIYMANNDWPVVNPSETSTYTYGRWQADLIEYKNRWRMSANNDTSDGYDGGWNNPAAKGGTTDIPNEADSSRPSNVPAGSADWSADWGDLVAFNNNIHTVWHSLYDNQMYYRMLVNTNANSVKCPDGGAVKFPIDGKYPTITLDNNNRPLIVCYDETHKQLVAFHAKADINASTNLDGTVSFTQYTLASGAGVGLYPQVEVDQNGAVHLFYQDGSLGALVYAHADSIANLNSATKIVVDTQSAPGYYTDLRVDSQNVACTYIAYGGLGTNEAIRVARCPLANVTNESSWQIIPIMSEFAVSENKVRGFFNSSGKLVLFGMSTDNGPQFYREQ